VIILSSHWDYVLESESSRRDKGFENHFSKAKLTSVLVEVAALKRRLLAGASESRLPQLDLDFADARAQEEAWPPPQLDVKPMYTHFREDLDHLCCNIVCGCCVCVSHDSSQTRWVSSYYSPLSLLRANPREVPYNFVIGCMYFLCNLQIYG
jgi:hypothetical protein